MRVEFTAKIKMAKYFDTDYGWLVIYPGHRHALWFWAVYEPR